MLFVFLLSIAIQSSVIFKVADLSSIIYKYCCNDRDHTECLNLRLVSPHWNELMQHETTKKILCLTELIESLNFDENDEKITDQIIELTKGSNGKYISLLLAKDVPKYLSSTMLPLIRKLDLSDRMRYLTLRVSDDMLEDRVFQDALQVDFVEDVGICRTTTKNILLRKIAFYNKLILSEIQNEDEQSNEDSGDNNKDESVIDVSIIQKTVDEKEKDCLYCTHPCSTSDKESGELQWQRVSYSNHGCTSVLLECEW